MSKNLKIIFVIIVLLTSVLVILLLNKKNNDKNKSNNEMTYVENKKEDKKCIVEKESMYRNVYLSKWNYNQLCNYKDTFIKDLIINDKYNLVNNRLV